MKKSNIYIFNSQRGSNTLSQKDAVTELVFPASYVAPSSGG